MKDSGVHLSEFIVAKIKGLIPGLQGHPDISNELLAEIPQRLNDPVEILQDTRVENKKYLFINVDPHTLAVVELERLSSGLTEINTFHKINEAELARMERQFPIIYKKEPAVRNPLSPHRSGTLSGGAGGGISGLKADSSSNPVLGGKQGVSLPGAEDGRVPVSNTTLEESVPQKEDFVNPLRRGIRKQVSQGIRNFLDKLAQIRIILVEKI
jgi:hypothetical protein